MPTRAQAARANINKAQKTWRPMSSGVRATVKGRGRAKPGATGRGKYYHIEVRPSSEFTTFRTQDVGDKGGIERVAGKRSSGSWDTQKWLISKDHAMREMGTSSPTQAMRKRSCATSAPNLGTLRATDSKQARDPMCRSVKNPPPHSEERGARTYGKRKLRERPREGSISQGLSHGQRPLEA